MKILALDIGLKRTGVAFADATNGVPLSLETIHHSDIDALSEVLHTLIKDRGIEHVAIGLPLLPSGEEGEQAHIVRGIIEQISFPSSVKHSFIDERYSTPRDREVDPDAAAACAILTTYLDQKNS